MVTRGPGPRKGPGDATLSPSLSGTTGPFEPLGSLCSVRGTRSPGQGAVISGAVLHAKDQVNGVDRPTQERAGGRRHLL
jgi:hypothetical protein